MIEDRLRRAIGFDHRNPVPLDDDGVGGGGGAAVGAEDELGLLTGDQLLDQGRRDVGIALVVLVLDLDGMLDVVDHNPAPLVDPVEPEIVPLLGETAFLGLRAGQRDGGSEDEGRPAGGRVTGAARAAGGE